MTHSAQNPPTVIRIAAGVIVNPAGSVLLVRKRGTTVWMQPGGKIEVNEAPADTLARELQEELGLELDAATFEYWGRFHADAANEADHVVDAEVYFLTIDTSVEVAAEIEELVWIDLDEDHALPLAPLSSQYLFPLLAAHPSQSP